MPSESHQCVSRARQRVQIAAERLARSLSYSELGSVDASSKLLAVVHVNSVSVQRWKFEFRASIQIAATYQFVRVHDVCSHKQRRARSSSPCDW